MASLFLLQSLCASRSPLRTNRLLQLWWSWTQAQSLPSQTQEEVSDLTQRSLGCDSLCVFYGWTWPEPHLVCCVYYSVQSAKGASKHHSKASKRTATKRKIRNTHRKKKKKVTWGAPDWSEHDVQGEVQRTFSGTRISDLFYKHVESKMSCTFWLFGNKLFFFSPSLWVMSNFLTKVCFMAFSMIGKVVRSNHDFQCCLDPWEAVNIPESVKTRCSFRNQSVTHLCTSYSPQSTSELL